MTTDIQVPVVIVGAGIAGLWLANRLKVQGVEPLLIEQEAIGASQTIASQGIIHGGSKYALDGHLTESAKQVASVTERWQQCFVGEGELNLSDVTFLSDQHLMWLRSRFTSGIKSLVSRQMLSSNSTVLEQSVYPKVFQQADLIGHLCAVHEKVLNVPSLINALAKPLSEQIILGNGVAGINHHSSGSIESITLSNASHRLNITAQQYIFTAGFSNQHLKTAHMQTRPLRMSLVKSLGVPLPEVYVHIIEKGATPIATITSHQDIEGNIIWYIGGELAEAGSQMSANAHEVKVFETLKRTFHWLNFQKAVCHSFIIDRAEPFNKGKRPAGPEVQSHHNYHVAWPTKLTMAPLLSDKLLSMISVSQKLPLPTFSWPKAPLAKPIWTF